MKKRFSLRIPKWLDDKISEKSKDSGISKNTLIILAIKEYLKKFDDDVTK